MTQTISFRTISFTSIIALILVLTACRKDISVPNQQYENLFGTWTWIESTGGESGQAISPATEGYSITVEYNENGVFKRFRDGKKISKMTFKFVEGNSMFSAGQVPMIEYKEKKITTSPLKKGILRASVSFTGNDTLFVSDECYDCYTHLYVRKK